MNRLMNYLGIGTAWGLNDSFVNVNPQIKRTLEGYKRLAVLPVGFVSYNKANKGK